MSPRSLIGLALVLGSCAAPGPTYYQTIEPIVDAKCAGCHRTGGIAPFSLESYEAVRLKGEEAVEKVAAGVMPPWPPSPGCNEYVADRSLTSEQQEVLRQWVDAGMPEGDPETPAPALLGAQPGLSRVDLRLEIPEPFQPELDREHADEYRCFVLPFVDVAAPTFVTGLRAAPGDPRTVHHVLVFYAAPERVADYEALAAADEGPGYRCFGGPGGSGRDVMLGGWAPGSLGSDFPPGTGLPIAPGAAAVLQVHYHWHGTAPAPDQTAVELRLDPDVVTPAQVLAWADPRWLEGDMRIPAGDPDAVAAFQFDATVLTGGRDFEIHSASMHQHVHGSRNEAAVERPDGTTECLLRIDAWDFDWQGSYGLRRPVEFHLGDRLRIECHWDNARGVTDLNWGEGTEDEMCVGFFYVTPR